MENHPSLCMTTNPEDPEIFQLNFSVASVGSSIVMGIQLMGGLRMSSFPVAWRTAEENFSKPFQKSGGNL